MGSRRETGRRPRAAGLSKIAKNLRDVRFVIFVLFATFSFSPQAQQATSWPQFRGNPALTGVASSEVPQALSLKWTYEAGETVESSAAIAEGAVFVGAGNGNLLAIDV